MKFHKMTPFPTSYCLATQEELEKWCKAKKCNAPRFEANCSGSTVAFGSYFFVVCSGEGKHWDKVDTLIHESVHVFQGAMEYIGEPVSGIEAQAYHIAGIATNLLKDYNDRYGRQ